MAGISTYNCEGTLTINSVSMNRPAWAVEGDETGNGGLLKLWATVDVRGEDRLLPSAAGVIPYQRRLAPTVHELRLLVTGDVDLSGSVNSDSRTGLAANLAYLYTNVIAPTGTGDGTRAATLTIFGASTRSANIHVLGLEMQRYNLATDSTVFEGLLRISIPAGRFA